MRRILLSAAALSLLGAASLEAQTYQQLTNSLGGAGCPGTGGTPTLFSLDEPRINAAFTIQVQNVPPSLVFIPGLAGFVYGFSKTEWSGYMLPYDLGNLGVFNCFAHVSIDAVLPVTYGFGAVTVAHTLVIPNDPNLVGLDFYNQCAFLDALADPVYNRRVTVSNAMQGVIGPPK